MFSHISSIHLGSIKSVNWFTLGWRTRQKTACKDHGVIQWFAVCLHQNIYHVWNALDDERFGILLGDSEGNSYGQ